MPQCYCGGTIVPMAIGRRVGLLGKGTNARSMKSGVCIGRQTQVVEADHRLIDSKSDVWVSRKTLEWLRLIADSKDTLKVND
jgi:hypothetical protein